MVLFWVARALSAAMSFWALQCKTPASWQARAHAYASGKREPSPEVLHPVKFSQPRSSWKQRARDAHAAFSERSPWNRPCSHLIENRFENTQCQSNKSIKSLILFKPLQAAMKISCLCFRHVTQQSTPHRPSTGATGTIYSPQPKNFFWHFAKFQEDTQCMALWEKGL